MYLTFVISYITLLFVFLFKKREFDFISLYVITLFVYNSISLIGVTYDPYAKAYLYDLDPRVFISLSIPFFTTIPFLLWNCDKRECLIVAHNKVSEIGVLNTSNIFLGILFIASLYGFIFIFPKILLGTNKVEIMNATGLLENIFIHTLPVAGAYMSLLNRNKIAFLFFMGVLLCIFLTGKRSPLVFAFLGIIIILNQGKRFRLIARYKLLLIGCVLLLFVAAGKTFYGYLLRYGLSGINLWLDDFSLHFVLSGIEGNSASAILNAIVKNDFVIGGEYIAKSLFAITPIPLSYFDFSSSYFNDIFQSELFPEVTYGMAYNPWAEAYSWLKNIGVFIYSLGLLFCLRILWKLYKSSGRELSAIFLFLGVITAFWIHRNSLASILAYNRNALYPLLAVYLIYRFLKTVLPLKRGKL